MRKRGRMAKRRQSAEGCGCLALVVLGLAALGGLFRQREPDTAPVSPFVAPPIAGVARPPAGFDLSLKAPPVNWTAEEKRAWWVARNAERRRQKREQEAQIRLCREVDRALAQDEQWRAQRPVSPSVTGSPTPEAPPPAYEALQPAQVSVPAANRGRPGKCNPYGICTACSSCSSCGHCGKGGGKCSVCM